MIDERPRLRKSERERLERTARKRRDDRLAAYAIAGLIICVILPLLALAGLGFVTAWMELLTGHGERPWDWLDGPEGSGMENSLKVWLWLLLPCLSLFILAVIGEGIAALTRPLRGLE